MDRDCTLYSNDSGLCAEEQLLAGSRTADGTRWWDAAMHFQLEGQLPTNTVVTSAKLRLYKVGGAAEDLSSFPMTSAWTGDASWDSPDGSGSWLDPLDRSDEENASATVSVDEDGAWYEWDVTDLAVQWRSIPGDNFGVMLADASTVGAGSAEFASSEAGSTTAPQLVVDYTTGAAPVLAPLAHSAPVPTGAPTFTDDITATATNLGSGVKSLTLRGLAAGDVQYELPCGSTGLAACPGTLTHVFHVDTSAMRTGFGNTLSVTARGVNGAVSNVRSFSLFLQPSCQQLGACAAASHPCANAGADPTAGGGSATPTVSSSGDKLVAKGARVDTSVSKNAANGVLMQTNDTAICVTPVDVSAQAASAQVTNSSTTVNFENTAAATSTQVVAKSDGIETFDTIKAAAAPEEFSWKISLGPNEALMPGSDGSVAIVNTDPSAGAPAVPTPSPADPTQIPTLKANGTIPADVEAPDAAAAAAALGAVAATTVVQPPAPAANGDTTAAQAAVTPPAAADTVLGDQPPDGDTAALPPSATPPPGLTAPAPGAPAPAAFTDQVTAGYSASTTQAKADAQARLDAAQDDVVAGSDAQASAAKTATVQAPGTVTVAVFDPPTAKDGNGVSVPATLTVDGDTVTMHVDHRGAGFAYPIVADPMVRVNDYRWVTHCCNPVYTWQPRSHGVWQFNYIGSYFGSGIIHNSPSYVWGVGHDGRWLYNVYFGGRWVLVHDEPWSGVFLPVYITVQDPPVRVLTGWQSYQTYDLVGSHLELRFDPDKDCQFGQPTVDECFGDAALVNDSGAHASSAPNGSLAPTKVRQLEPIIHILPDDPFLPMDFRTVFAPAPGTGARAELMYPSGNHYVSVDSTPIIDSLQSKCPRADCFLRFPADVGKDAMITLSDFWHGTVGTNAHAKVYYVQRPGNWGVARQPVNVIQYWYFYSYNYFNSSIGEKDRHQGDWESVTVIWSKMGGKPIAVRFSAHKTKHRVLEWPQLDQNIDVGNGIAYGTNRGESPSYSNHASTWVALGDHANLPACGGSFPTEAPFQYDKSCSSLRNVGSTRTYLSGDTVMEELKPGPTSPWCWRGGVGMYKTDLLGSVHPGEVRMPLNPAQQGGISNFDLDVAHAHDHYLSGGIVSC